MDRAEDKSWQREEAVAFGLHSMQAQEDSMLRRTSSLQALLALENSLRVQSRNAEGCTKNRLYGYA